MNPIRKLRSPLKRGLTRAWGELTQEAREMLMRSRAAITHFARAAKPEVSPSGVKDLPCWGFLPCECWETANAVIVRIELPGMRREDIDVSIYRGSLRLRGEKRYSPGAEAPHHHLMERAFGRFERRLSLPAKVDPHKGIEMSYEDGVVTVIVPKAETTPPIQSTR